MNRIVQGLKHSLVALAAAALLAGCVENETIGPDQESSAQLASIDAAQNGTVATSAAQRNVDLGPCDNLQVPAGNRLAFRLYATGVQIYRWNGTSWSFIAPEARLFATERARVSIGTHYAGPTWAGLGGSKVIGTVLDRCTADADNVQWLLLATASTEGRGIFKRVTFIQRINTEGGIAPANAGTVSGEEARVPYTTDYLFYYAK
jgi:hypothetical protein